MIRHDYVAPGRDIKLNDGATSVLLQSKLSTIQRRNNSAVASRKSDKVEWLIDVNQIKSMRTVLDHFPDCRASRARCNHPVLQATRLPLQLRSIGHSRLDHLLVIIRSKNDVIMQAQVC